ncbi:transient receptor potential-gamma protein [Reticulomyxa filosa]|uniref:Transient receptor potential-gamma protein n=1 Tax=Reticulomyxa filosa TaxID=46433 RepID=X6P136_RETFI|nr:transient receptor potential-gamma protein [Reticulomyxa filosa]|eukprot:ETO31843.1 transient receptor potential-gamma protein [Reticulomyxa filosa]
MYVNSLLIFLVIKKKKKKLRKLKEAIRLFVFYMEVGKEISDYRPPETLAEQMAQFLKMKSAVISLSQAKPLPLPTLPEIKEANIVREMVSMFDKNKADKHRALKFRRERKVTALRICRREQFRRYNQLKKEKQEKKELMQWSRNVTRRTMKGGGTTRIMENTFSKKMQTNKPILPKLLYDLDVYTYGKPLWYFCVHQLSVKDRESVWDCLIYLANQLPTAIAVRLLEENRELLSKLQIKSLDELCQAIIETSEFPEATSLYLAAFMKERADHDLSRKEQFTAISEKYIAISTGLLSEIENDHLLAILVEIPCDIDKMSMLDIAIRFHLDSFLDFHRLSPLMLQMWNKYEYLDPKENFLQIERSNFQTLHTLITSPNRFYFSAIGRYFTQFFLYFFYVLFISWITYLRIYPFEKLTLQEEILWLANVGFILFQLVQLVIEGRHYFANLFNYCDLAIMCVWIALFIMRFLIPSRFQFTANTTNGELSHHYSVLKLEKKINSNYTTTYMLFWSLQCILVWTRLLGFFRRNTSTGVFFKMAMKMMTDIFSFLILLILFTAGFVLALYYIVSSDLRISHPDICTYDAQFRYELYSLAQSVLYIFQTLLGEQDWTTINERYNLDTGVICFSWYRSRLAQCVVALYSVVGTIILLNLLLALMASTYYAMKERARVESNFSRFQDTIDTARRHGLMSPPFNIVVIVVMAVVSILDNSIRVLTRGKYVLNANFWFPIRYSLNRDLIVTKNSSWRRSRKNKRIPSRLNTNVDNTGSVEVEMKTLTAVKSDEPILSTDQFAGADEAADVWQNANNTESGNFDYSTFFLNKKKKNENEASVRTPISSQNSDIQEANSGLFLSLKGRKCVENPFEKPDHCRYCRHYIGDKKGNINDYFELFQEYQIVDDADKDLMKKLLYRRTICPICFRPFTEGSKYHRWQVMLEVLSFYVFLLFIWIPLIIFLFIPALLDRFWAHVKVLQKPQSETTNALINADIDLEQIDFEYKEIVRSKLSTTTQKQINEGNSSFFGDELSIKG